MAARSLTRSATSPRPRTFVDMTRPPGSLSAAEPVILPRRAAIVPPPWGVGERQSSAFSLICACERVYVRRTRTSAALENCYFPALRVRFRLLVLRFLLVVAAVLPGEGQPC